MEKFIKILLAVALFCSSMSALVNAESPQTATSELQTVILERVFNPKEPVPRMPCISMMLCHYCDGYIEIDIPQSFSSLNVELWNDDILVWEGTLSPACNSITLPSQIIFSKIACTNELGLRYLSIVF